MIVFLTVEVCVVVSFCVIVVVVVGFCVVVALERVVVEATC